jgi:hypothetical protein
MILTMKIIGCTSIASCFEDLRLIIAYDFEDLRVFITYDFEDLSLTSVLNSDTILCES